MGERKSLALLADIPRFSELSFDSCPEAELAELIQDVQELIAQEKGAEEAARSLLSFQQILLSQQSQQNYQRIIQALRTSVGSPGPEATTETLSPLRLAEAKGKVYRAIANYPYEAMKGSASDMDLWSRAWRWSRFEELIPVELWDRESYLVTALQNLKPSLRAIWQEVNQSGLPPDAGIAQEDRLAFFHALLAKLQEEAAARTQLSLELLAVRQQIAKLSGFANYSDYHEARRGKRSFGRKAELNFIKDFRSHFLPLWQEFKELKIYRWGEEAGSWLAYPTLSQYGQVPLSLDLAKIEAKFASSLAELTGHPQHFLLNLIEKGYVSYDSGVREKLGQSSCLLMSVPASFLALPLDGQQALTRTFLDTGSALADISAMLNYHSLGSSRQDAFSKQVSAYLFLVLAKEELPGYYGENADLAWDMEWVRQLQESFLQSFYYLWENRLYHLQTRPNVIQLRKGFQQLLAEELDFIGLPSFSEDILDLLWPYVFSLNLEAYQSLAPVLAWVTILAAHPQRLSSSLFSHKLNNFLLTNPGGAILDRLQEADLPSPFSQGVLKKASFSLCDLLQL
ncbi:MAG: hypothetical protein Q4D97_01120 [Eubacteriales bacterium]|nr:hypothetical protein [Eubacteriales bacterium]